MLENTLGRVLSSASQLHYHYHQLIVVIMVIIICYICDRFVTAVAFNI